MTFEEFRRQVMEICETVNPGGYFRVSLSAYESAPAEWQIATDIWPSDLPDGGDIWYCIHSSPERAIASLQAQVERGATRCEYNDEYRRQVAEAMGVL